MDDFFRSKDFRTCEQIMFRLGFLYSQPVYRAFPPPDRTSSRYLSKKLSGLGDMPYGAREECSSRHKGGAANFISPAVV